MPHKAWRVIGETEQYRVELDWGDAWGNLIVKVDGDEVSRGLFIWPFTATGTHFWVGEESAVLRVSGIFTPEWNLYVGGKLIREEKGETERG
jgi:hypothetical protein